LDQVALVVHRVKHIFALTHRQKVQRKQFMTFTNAFGDALFRRQILGHWVCMRLAHDVPIQTVCR
jgi:hypothetical protein